MIFHKCDRCNRDIPSTFGLPQNRAVTVSWESESGSGIAQVNFDLCEHCAKKLLDEYRSPLIPSYSGFPKRNA